MSRQVNFFADPEDAQALHSWLLQGFPGLTVIPKDRGQPEELELVPAEERLTGHQKMFLVPQWARDGVVLLPRLHTDGLFVDASAAPIIEYSPCILHPDSNTLTVGRLYWAFDGELEPDERRQLDRMFRWVRAHTIPTPRDTRFRVFEHAARNQRILDYDFGIKEPSPPWAK